MKRQSVAWIDHSYHQKTKSSLFLKKLLEAHFDVTEYWDDSWNGGKSIPASLINRHNYAVFLQVLSPASILKDITIPILWIPMYDGEKFNYGRWKILSRYPIRILSFSRAITLWAKRFSLPTLTVQYYYIPPVTIRFRLDGIRILFWYRGGIDFNDIRRIIDPRQVQAFTIIDTSDPGQRPLVICDADRSAYQIQIIRDGFTAREDYLALLNNSTVFIAPRKKEGIGAFTEALALGKCVIAYNDAVHNEYITHGVDGILFDEKTRYVDLSHIDQIGEMAWRRACTQHALWTKDCEKIISFIREPYTVPRPWLPIRVWKYVEQIIDTQRKLRYYARLLGQIARSKTSS